jgi:predicted XRE-type DNA-binding protein
MSGEKDTGVTHGSTNVFADLGLPDAVERQTKTRLAMQVNELLKDRRLKQVEAARVLGIPQPKISALANYRLDGFSVEKLMEFLTLLNQDVEILIRPARENLAPGHVSVHAVR